METKKTNKYSDRLRSFLIIIVPTSIIRMIMNVNYHYQNFVLDMVITLALFSFVDFLREKIKSKTNNDLPIFLMFLIFLPSGFYYLWKYSNRTKTTKTIITTIIAGFLVFMIILAKI